MKKRFMLTASGIALLLLTAIGGQQSSAGVDCGEPVPAPKFQVGDKWVSRNEKGGESTSEVIGFEGDLAQIKWKTPWMEPDKEGVILVGPDRVIRKAIRPNGEVVIKQGRGRPFDLIGQREFDFPLQVGKKWDFTYTSGSGETGTRH